MVTVVHVDGEGDDYNGDGHRDDGENIDNDGYDDWHREKYPIRTVIVER